MAFYLFFLEIAFKADLRKGFLDLMNVFLIFLFCLISKWNASVWFDVFFWKMVVDVRDSVCKNVG